MSPSVKLLADLVEECGAVRALVEELIRRGTLEAMPTSWVDSMRDVFREEFRRADPDRQARVEYLSVDAAAKYASVKPATIREWIKRGKLAAAHAGSRWRVRRTDLEASLARQTASPGPDPDEEARRLFFLEERRRR